MEVKQTNHPAARTKMSKLLNIALNLVGINMAASFLGGVSGAVADLAGLPGAEVVAVCVWMVMTGVLWVVKSEMEVE